MPPPPVVLPPVVQPPAPQPSTQQTDVPEGLLLDLAYKSGALEGVQLGVAYWFNETWGLGVQSGFASRRSTRSVTYTSGRRRVTGMEWGAAPEASLLVSPVRRKNLRLVTALGGGMHFSKPERENVERGFHTYAGLGVQWTVLDRFSIQVGEQLQWVAFRGAETSTDLSLASQLSASWWFE